MTQLLLTGAGGSIGCHMLEHLLVNTDWRIACIDSFRHKGLTDRIACVLKARPKEAHRVRVFTHDLAAPVSQGLISKIGCVDHFVAMASLSDVHDSIIDPAPFILNNVQVALHCLEYARAVKPRTFLLVSTDEVYGPTDGKTLHPEWSPIVPSNAYSSSKASQEACCTGYWRSYGVPLILCNLMNNFAEMQSPYKFPAIVQRKVRAGETVEIHTSAGTIGSRFYLHSRNASDAMLFLLRNVVPPLHRDGCCDKPERFNVVGERQIDNLALAQLIASYIGKPLKYEMKDSSLSRPGHDIHYGLDGSKLASLGWKPPVPFEESLRRTVAWYEKNPHWLYPGI